MSKDEPTIKDDEAWQKHDERCRDVAFKGAMLLGLDIRQSMAAGAIATIPTELLEWFHSYTKMTEYTFKATGDEAHANVCASLARTLFEELNERAKAQTEKAA